MKLPLIIACLIIAAATSAQESRSTTKSISDDGDKLSVKYEVRGSGKSINYSNEFEVKGWTKQQKDQLVSRIIDSLENNSAKTRDRLSTHIDDDGVKMKVVINGRRNGNDISFNKTYDVKGMNQEQKKAIVEELIKSLGLSSKQQ
jgi:predicted GIY-YIG superfamily endonuclease